MSSKKKAKARVKTNMLDKVIGYFSPRALLRRKKARLWNEFLEKRKYDGADSGRRTSGWNTNNQSANAEIAVGMAKVRNRARDLVRNNPWAARGLQVIVNNVVGRGIKTQLKEDNDNKTSDREKKINEVWRTWAETAACDYEGINNLAGMQRVIKRAVCESGEVFVRIRRTRRRRNVPSVNGGRVELPPIQLQVLESDFVSLTKRSGVMNNGNQIVQGIEFDNKGRKVAYHVFLAHPGSNDVVFGSRFQTTRIPASQMLHLYRMDRPGQSRGMSWFANIILRLRDFDLYEDAQLKRQQTAALFSAFIYDSEGLDEDEETALEVEMGEKMEPGVMEVLPPGKDIKFPTVPTADNYGEYTGRILHAVASGLGITYSQLTGDLSEVNFSSGRMGLLESHRNFDTWRDNIMIAQFLTPVVGEFLDGMALLGENVSGFRAVHTSPRREMIDPVKETQAQKMAVRSGFKTLSEVVRESGKDPDLHYAEMQQDAKTLDDAELILDTDPRRTANSGSLNEESEPESDNENEGGASQTNENE